MGRRAEDGRRQKLAGRQVKLDLRQEIWGAARRHWKRLLLIGVFIVGCAAVLIWVMTYLGAPMWQRGFLAGLVVGIVPLLHQTFLIGQGFASRQMGSDAEQWTAEELTKLDERNWAVFHDVPPERANVDHVAVGPGRIYAIETKWTVGQVTGWLLKRYAGQAEHRAAGLKRRLAALGATREVLPLLVIWGPHVREALGDTPRRDHSTRVVYGGASDAWLTRMRDAADKFAIDHPARRAVAQIILLDDGSYESQSM